MAIVDHHTLQVIEFDCVRQLLAAHASCALGRSMALKLKPVHRVELVATWLGQLEELLEADASIGLPPFAGVHDIRAAVRAAVPPHCLEPEEFAVLAETFDATAQVVKWSAQLGPGAPHLQEICARVGDFSILGETIHRIVDLKGQIRDDASAKLHRIRIAIAGDRIKVGQVVDRLLRDRHITRWLRYPQATFHEDRLVLPLSADYRGRVPGIVHRSSDSGATLFVEPAEAVELNNRIIALKSEETAEINRLLWHLTHQIQLNQGEILNTLEALAVLDLVTAKARFAKAYQLTCPKIAADGQLRLHQARHLLLVELHRRTAPAGEPARDVVPVSLRLGEDFDVLVITGPNTGGKTVALKTAALVCAMAAAGLPVAAALGSQVPIYQDILLDIGDEQSLQQSLSTFSAHMKRLLTILDQARPDTLVLIDELGAGTDPDEGAALGQAIVQELLDRRCPSLVTTHLGVLKTIAYSHPRAQNASVDFDVETLQPTYHLRIGEPGNSNAIHIAARLGLPANLVQAARSRLSESHEQLARAIRGTLVSRRQAEAARTEADTARQAAEEARKQLERQQVELAERQQAFDRWVQTISALRPGDKVHVQRFDRPGQIVRVLLHKQLAVVNVGVMEVEVPLRELRPL
ncbi:MAG TPA: DNA strand exchange inhibitor protein [Phycisphaerae bacterium]|nr:DNA strand exchange inhibitor protein [Phycisphaerae bacterium]